ncbi:MAG: Riboflavin biosynthesis protein RibF [Bacteroidetes bacterium ADurb.Bin174]|nr:MAG: Riboflavin biosynthesis protein RibF [Bacteroidetes bacterium ADurb.Bin174]
MNHTTQKYAATIGLFDGVHAGHRYLIDSLKKEAEQRGLKSMVLTFNNNPKQVLRTNFKPQLLTTPAEKRVQLQSLQLDSIVELEFTKEMAALSAFDFIQILHDKFQVGLLLVGYDHRFGKDRADGFPEYVAYGKQIGVEVIKTTRFSTPTLKQISSSAIRAALANGNIEQATTLLSYPYSFEGEVISGYQVGRKIGFATANLKPVHPDKIIPGLGVYLVEIFWQNRPYKAMMNIGRRPTIDNDKNISLEVHILDFQEDIYGQNLKVSFLKKIRDEKKFNAVEDLVEQLKKDRAFVVQNWD